jgi:membrane protein
MAAPSGSTDAAREVARGPIATSALLRWRRALVAAVRAFAASNISVVAAGVTFFTLLAVFPALSAFVSLYGLVANVADAQREVGALRGLLPGGGLSVLADELTRLVTTDHGTLGLAFGLSLAVSLWSATSGVKALMQGLNIAYHAQEHRNFFHLNLVSLAFTLGAIAAAIAALALLVAAPALLAGLGLGGFSGLAYLKWPILLAVAVVLFSVLYRFAPCRPRAQWRWITPGGCLAAVGWLVMSALFSWYVANFGHYNKTYGSLGAIVGFLTWVWLSLMVLLFGAELNASLERQAEAPSS